MFMVNTYDTLTADQIHVWRAAYAVQEKRKRSPRIAEIQEKSGYNLGKTREAIAALKAVGICKSEEGRLGTLLFLNPNGKAAKA